MTALACMTLSDWGQHGTAMAPQSARIREWLGEEPYLFATASMKQYKDRASLDRSIVDHIAAPPTKLSVVEIQRLDELLPHDVALQRAITVLRPNEEEDCDLVAELVHDGRLQKLFVMVHHEKYAIRVWLDAMGALNLHAGVAAERVNPVLLAAAEAIQREEYNGLKSGRGKDAIVQLVRAFAAHGHPADPELWARAYFAVGGSFRHAATISELVSEVRRGVRHRVKPAYRDDVYDVLLAQSAEEGESEARSDGR
ncbi:hypothetical protein [Microbacterium sp. RURRCA19A]|uniref:hypothetical protein n=1 Tax=Microbacterium sp. RURRCA19A TaxID=1907391 RepID=UPI000970E236|nr:hypothetical protein [Microbacterium sp. RURRCA19A]